MASGRRIRRRLLSVATVVAVSSAAATLGAAWYCVPVEMPVAATPSPEVAAVVTSAVAPVTSATPKMFDLIKRVVQVHNGDGGGSGTILGSFQGVDGTFRTYILTAEHVVEDAKEVVVIDFHYLRKLQVASSLRFNAKVVDTSKEIDCALLEIKTDDSWGRSVELVRSDTLTGVTLGDKIIAIGGPALEPPSVTEGRLAVWGRKDFRFSAPIAGGDSGGAVFLHDGRLIGMITGCKVLDSPMGLTMVCHMAVGTTAPIMATWLKAIGAGFLVGDKDKTVESLEKTYH